MRAFVCVSVLALTTLSGCLLQNLSATRVLTDQVYALNDEIRWARVDLATERVSPEYRPVFLAQLRSWGHNVQIADSDTTHVQISDDMESATSLTTLSWYDQSTMELHTSVIQQRWVKNDGGGFMLDLVRVVGGESSLFEDVPPEIVEAAEAAQASRESEES